MFVQNNIVVQIFLKKCMTGSSALAPSPDG